MDRTESNFIADKQKEYRLYLIWQSLDKTLTPETLESWGITDETLLELSQYKTQKALAQYLGINPQTITHWNKQQTPEEYRELDWRYWAKKITPKIVASMAKQGIKTGSPNHFTAWMKYVEQAEEKTTLKIDTTEQILEGIKNIIERNQDAN